MEQVGLRELRRVGLLVCRAWSGRAFAAGLPVHRRLPLPNSLPLRESDGSQGRTKDPLLLVGRFWPPTSLLNIIPEVQASALR